jgi:hypothetical protein
MIDNFNLDDLPSVGCDHNTNFYLQTGEQATLAGVSFLNLSPENYEKAITSQDWSQSYHPNIKRYVNDPIPLLWSKNLSFDQFDTNAIKEFS